MTSGVEMLNSNFRMDLGRKSTKVPSVVGCRIILDDRLEVSQVSKSFRLAIRESGFTDRIARSICLSENL